MRLDMSIRQVSGMKINTKLKLLRHEELFFPAATQNPRPAREEKDIATDEFGVPDDVGPMGEFSMSPPFHVVALGVLNMTVVL